MSSRFRWLGWTPVGRPGVVLQVRRCPTPGWTGVGHRSGLGLDTGLDWGWTAVWTGVGTQEGPAREGGASVLSSVRGWPGCGRGLHPGEVVGLQADVSQLAQSVAPGRTQAG